MKTIDNYMSKEQGRSVSGSQRLVVNEWNKLTKALDTLRTQKDVLLKCGLAKEAKAVVAKINELEVERRRLEDRLNDERREMAKAMLVCFAACDLATTAADVFADTMHRLSHGLYKPNNSFSESIREQANSFNKLVQTIDEGGHEPLSLFYADMAEEVNAKVLPIMQQVINDYCNSPLGKRYF